VDDEIKKLLIDELEKQLAVVSEPRDESGEPHLQRGERRALHSLKGSFAMAEEPALAEAFGRLERRFVGGDASALVDARRLALTALDALRTERPIPREVWPEPPADLAPRQGPHAPGYVESVVDRLARIDHALASDVPDDQLWISVFREVHTIKGAALAVGDELMAWFAHGLEEHLKSLKSLGARRLADELAQHRAVMAEILESPMRALGTLRLISGAAPPSVRAPIDTPLPLPPKRPTLDYDRKESRPIGDDSVRVGIATLERLFERAAQLGQVRGPLAGNVASLERGAGSILDVQRALREALRLIGPPKPWGAPAAAIDKVEAGATKITEIARLLERSVEQLREASARVGREGAQIQSTVSAMRTTQAGRMFEAIAASTATQAGREGKDVAVVVTGGDTPIDRRLADALADPLGQLTRNSVAHGIEPPEIRAARGKPRTGTIELRAQMRAGSLVIEVVDDGAGVDTGEVRRSAVHSGAISADFAAQVPDRALLSLLFVPGFTTRKSADVHAGRGVGLDLTLAAIHRLGGTIQLANEAGRGLSSTIVVPAEGALVKVLWIEGRGIAFALPLAHTRRIVRAAESALPVRSLGDLLPAALFESASRSSPDRSARLAVEIVDPMERRGAVRSFALEVDAVGVVEEVAPRALAPIVRMSGPFESAILWGDEIRLLLDTDALLAQAIPRDA
jgi:chemotaxis protein histidine kinase CheA